MKLEKLNKIEDIKRFLNGTDIVAFNVVSTRCDNRQPLFEWLLQRRCMLIYCEPFQKSIPTTANPKLKCRYVDQAGNKIFQASLNSRNPI
jgi:hypothetical protein